jgi:hypothetical protein
LCQAVRVVSLWRREVDVRPSQQRSFLLKFPLSDLAAAHNNKITQWAGKRLDRLNAPRAHSYTK